MLTAPSTNNTLLVKVAPLRPFAAFGEECISRLTLHQILPGLLNLQRWWPLVW